MRARLVSDSEWLATLSRIRSAPKLFQNARPHTTASAPAASEPADQKAFLDDLGLSESALTRILRTAYALLDLISFFTVGEDEVRAWPILRGTKARQAAGRIHSDLERGFIRAEVTHYPDFMTVGSEARARQEGKLRLEGKEYVVHDGDIMNIRFAV